ncbi:MAG: DUF4336 domain-containing protein [Polyangiales bacterium]
MLQPLTDGVWVADTSNSFFGLQLGARMTIVRFGDGTLLLHSPIAIDAAMKADIDALGPVAHIVAPNVFHHVYAKPAIDLYPSAKVHLAPGLEKKRPDLRADAVLGASPDPTWRDELESLPIDGTLLKETAFVHVPSGTLLCSDLVENFGTSDHWLTRAYLKVNGVLGKPGLSRALRFAFRDKRAARRSIDAILEHPIDKIALAHGDPIMREGQATLHASYTWLEP